MLRLTERDQQLLDGLEPSFRVRVYALGHELVRRGVPFGITDGRRTAEQQADVYRRKPDLAVPPGRSKHEVGYAADVSGPRNEAEWTMLGETAEQLGLRWGGRWQKREPWHVEDPRPREQLVALQEAGAAMLVALALGGLWAAARALRNNLT